MKIIANTDTPHAVNSAVNANTLLAAQGTFFGSVDGYPIYTADKLMARMTHANQLLAQGSDPHMRHIQLVIVDGDL
jgi:hypothetical protein